MNKSEAKAITNNRLLIICGPTATGKTGLGLELAERYEGEIVSCDSRQVYKYMDVITGKDIPGNIKYQISNMRYGCLQIGYYHFHNTRIWGYDLVRPDQEFNVHVYLEFVCRVIGDIWLRRKLPIIVGGTGMYLKALLSPPKTLGIPINSQFRSQLSQKSIRELWRLLMKLDPVRGSEMTDSDKTNPRRLIRAIEVALNRAKIKSAVKVMGKQKSKTDEKNLSSELLDYIKSVRDMDVLWLGLNYSDRKLLYEKIDERVEARINDINLVEEMDYLMEKDYLRCAPEVTIGYQQLIEWMGCVIKLNEAIEQWKYAEHGYARRQLTWFRKQKGINWFFVEEEGYKSKVEKLVREWYYKNIKNPQNC